MSDEKRKMIMRKIGVFLLVALMMISLTACKSDDYKEAMEL